jgi:hypothetical protein
LPQRRALPHCLGEDLTGALAGSFVERRRVVAVHLSEKVEQLLALAVAMHPTAVRLGQFPATGPGQAWSFFFFELLS